MTVFKYNRLYSLVKKFRNINDGSASAPSFPK